MHEITITLLEFPNLFSEVNPHKASGPDNISACVLKETVSVTAPILIHLFQQLFNTSDIPLEWKQAYVTPTHKKGSKSDPKYY